MERYREAYEDLQAECRAVNLNIATFRKNFDLLTLLQFLRGLDTVACGAQKHPRRKLHFR